MHLPPARILLVEDGVSNRKLISLVLQRAGVTVVQAENGQIGSDMALAEPLRSDSDGHADARDGRVRPPRGCYASRGFKTPIIALTAHAMRGDEEKCRAAGCTGFLTKPIDMDLLVRTVGESLGEQPAQTSTASPSIPSQIPGVMLAPEPVAGAGRLHSILDTSDPDFCEIVEEFVQRLGEQLGEIEAAWSKGEMDDLARLAHWVKGCGGTAGFDALTGPAKQLEHAAREKQLDSVGAALSALQGLADQIVAPSGASLKGRRPVADVR
jgi:CheY-like chemotaxis protein